MAFPLRLLLNSPFTGANAFLALADARGLFREAGLDITFTEGRGAYTAAARLYDEGFDAAYGDLNALIEQAALAPQRDPALAVCIVHQQAPSVIAVRRDGPIEGPAVLAGRTLIGHASDVALQTFGAYAAACGLDPSTVHLRTVDAPMATLLQTLLDGGADGVFGYTTTHTAALAGTGRRASEHLRFLSFRDACPWLYGSALMAAPALLRTRPEAVHALVRCTLAGIEAARQEPDAAIDAVLARSPQLDRGVERERWRGTLMGDVAVSPSLAPSSPSAGANPRPGDADDARLVQGIARLAAARQWAHVPLPAQVFVRDFLP